MDLKPMQQMPGATHFIAQENSEARLPFSLAVEANGLVFVSGQASVDENGAIVSGTFEEEFRRSMENLRAVLEGAGSSLERIVQVRTFIRDAQNVGLYNQLYREYFSTPFPARTTITGCLPPALHFEIDCIALAGGPREKSTAPSGTSPAQLK